MTTALGMEQKLCPLDAWAWRPREMKLKPGHRVRMADLMYRRRAQSVPEAWRSQHKSAHRLPIRSPEPGESWEDSVRGTADLALAIVSEAERRVVPGVVDKLFFEIEAVGQGSS